MMVFLIVLFGEGSFRQRNQHVQRQRGEAKYNITKESMIISQGVLGDQFGKVGKTFFFILLKT